MAPPSQATNIVITGILLDLDRISGLKQNVCCVKIAMSQLLSTVVIFMTWQTPLAKSQKSESSCRNRGYHCTCTYESAQVWQNSCPCYLLTNIGWTSEFSWGTLTNRTNLAPLSPLDLQLLCFLNRQDTVATVAIIITIIIISLSLLCHKELSTQI